MFGSTVALAGAHKVLSVCKRQPCLGCMTETIERHSDWMAKREPALRSELLDLYETPLTFEQMRTLFRLHPQIDCTSAAFDNSFHEDSGRRTYAQKALGRIRVRGFDRVRGA